MHEKDNNEPVRNPSPPPEVIRSLESEQYSVLTGDNIGNTLFSQHWLFQQLMEVLKYVDRNDVIDSDKACHTSTDEVNGSADAPPPIELDKEIEDSMCLLWDMSVELEVASFLMEFKARDIFMEVLIKTNAPRLQEIILGILGNMVTHKEICNHFTDEPSFMISILKTLASTDTPSLIQSLRFVQTCVINEATSCKWIEIIKEIHSCQDSFKFILASSLNIELLKSTLKLLYECLDKDDDFIDVLSTCDFVSAIMDAGNQIRLAKEFESLDEFWHMVQLITVYPDGTKLFQPHQGDFIKCAKEYFLDLSVEDSSPSENRLPAITSAFATISVLSESSTSLNNKDFDILKDSPVMDYVHNLKTVLSDMHRALSTDEDAEPSRTLILKEALHQIDRLLLSLNKIPGE